MPETQAPQGAAAAGAAAAAAEPAVFTIPWAEKRKELPAAPANEPLVAMNWDVNEELIFFFLMWLGTY